MLLIAANVNFSTCGAGKILLVGINSLWHLQPLLKDGEEQLACLCCEAESSAEVPFWSVAFSALLLSQHLLLHLSEQLGVISARALEKHLRHHLVTVE